MLPWQAAVDDYERQAVLDDYESEVPTAPNGSDYESEVPTAPNANSEREPTVRRMTPLEMKIARRTRPLYVPTPLPMAELKKALANADDEATWHSSTAIPSVPATARANDESPSSMPPSSAPTRLHVHRAPTPMELAKTCLAPTAERTFSSNVDKDEAKANAKWHYPIPPLPSLDEFAPIDPSYGQLPVVAEESSPSLSQAPAKPASHALRTAALFAVAIVTAGITIGIAHGDLTKDGARHAASMVLGAVGD